ncbi:hypothetical protein ATANTOWER_029896, partial [Ataeniobius toweri]|nr:hypothetical protein [Ataeniobius toweri]
VVTGRCCCAVVAHQRAINLGFKSSGEPEGGVSSLSHYCGNVYRRINGFCLLLLMPCLEEYGNSSLNVSAVSLHSASFLDPRFLASEDLPPACPPSHDKFSFFERIERRETQSQKNKEVLSSQLHPPANLNHRGTDLFLQSFSESSAL